MSDAFLNDEEEANQNSLNKNPFISYEERVEEAPGDIVFTHDSFFLADSAPYFVNPYVVGMREEKERENIVSYKVKKEDSISDIADSFGISKETIKWANNIKSNSDLEEGSELVILPVTGVVYYIERGDTIGEIAKMHKAKANDITAFNDINSRNLIAGDRIIIPGGELPPPPPPPPSPSPTPTTPSPGSGPSVATDSNFINPVPGGMITQGLHGYNNNAVDIYQPCGYRIVASTSGRVTEVDKTEPWPAGNFVKIDHGSVVVLYSHMERIDVSTGQQVSQGQQIGTVGNTGYTRGPSGCHLHFQFLSTRKRNPFGHLPVGSRL